MLLSIGQGQVLVAGNKLELHHCTLQVSQTDIIAFIHKHRDTLKPLLDTSLSVGCPPLLQNTHLWGYSRVFPKHVPALREPVHASSDCAFLR